MDLRHADLTGRVLGVFYDVYNELGPGFLESVYQRALAVGFRDAGIAAVGQQRLTVHFRGHPVGDFKADFVVESRVVVELKSAVCIDRIHEAQLLNYLRATDLEVGLLLNFGPRPMFRRLVYRNDRKRTLNPRSSA